ncbi:helix-turn-helix domain-containing protein [Urbifossiella limnaea]|nr:helix-turn-helix domain-containing protein [Urbifossiella limnaea]
MTVQEVADRWCVSRSTVYALVANGTLPHARLGVGRGTIRISEKDADEYLAKSRRDDAKTYAEHFA